MSLEITVRGAAEERFAAERAIVTMAASIEGPDREVVKLRAIGVHENIANELEDLRARGSVSSFSSEQVRVFAQRTWTADGARRSSVQAAQFQVVVDFADIDALSLFVDLWSGHNGVDVIDISWDVAEENRRKFEMSVRAAAVEDAKAKAQAYSDALGHGQVAAVKIADPGMLSGADPAPAVHAAMAASGMNGASGLSLRPAPVVIGAQVHVRFIADGHGRANERVAVLGRHRAHPPLGDHSR